MRAATLVLLAGCGSSAAPSPCDRAPSDAKAAITIGSCRVPSRTWRFAVGVGHGGFEERKQYGLDVLIDRELLAQGAIEAGIRIPSRDDVTRAMKDGDVMAFGAELPPQMFQDEDGAFDYQRTIRFAQQFNLADADQLVDEQVREQLARAMRDRLGDDVGTWLHDRCVQLRDAGKIVLAPAFADGYEACITAE